MPPFALFQIDDDMWISFYERKKKTVDCRQFRFEGDTRLGSFIQQQFEDLAADNKTLKLLQFLSITITLNDTDFILSYVRNEGAVPIIFYLLIDDHINNHFKLSIEEYHTDKIVQIVWKEKKFECQVTLSHMITYESIKESIKRKYGTVHFQHIYEATVIREVKK